MAALHLTSSASLLQLVHLPLVEFELTGLVLGQVRQVECDSDKVTLRCIVALILIIIDNHIVTIVLRRRHILEVVEVERICKNVIGVYALQGLALRLARVHHAMILIFRGEWHVERISAVLLLSLAPFAILVVETCPIVVNVLVQLDIANGKLREHLLNLLSNPVAADLENDQEDDAKDHGPQESGPTPIIEENEHLVVTLIDIGCRAAREQVIVGKKLLARGHPEAKEQHQDWRSLQAVEHVLTESLVVHGRHSVSVVQHCLLLEVENDHGQAGDGEQNRHAQTVHERDKDNVEER